MKEAIIGLDGGGSNLRIVVADKNTEAELYSKQINTGTNLSTVPDRQVALDNIVELVLEGARHVGKDYYISGIGLSSAGTEIKENKVDLEKALNQAVQTLKLEFEFTRTNPPECYVTNDIEILLSSADIAIVAGTGTVGAVKYKDIQPYDNTTEIPADTIYKLDGNGPHIGDKGSGYWIAKQVLTNVSEIDNLGGYMNSKGEFIEVEDSYLRDLVYQKLSEETGIKREDMPEFVSIVYSATQENGRPFDRAKVGNMFSILADKAASAGDETANDILDQASAEIFKNIRAAYKRGNFEDKESCRLLLSGSVLMHSDIVRFFLQRRVEQSFPNISIKVNDRKPVWSTVSYVKNKIDEQKGTHNGDEEVGR